MSPPLTVKFLRYFDVPSFTDNGSMFGIWLRLLYEFWGFCVNGTNDLKHPGGFPTGSTSDIHMSGVINMPNGWESGSNVLLHTGSDGITFSGTPWFTGSNFTTDHVGKYITLWQSGSTSTDDSIYLITKAYFSSTGSVIGIDVDSGGTPFTGTLRPSFTSRTNINYRVVDYAPINQTHTTYNFIILQMNGAPYVNSGQRNSQCRLRLASISGGGTSTIPYGIAILMSPSGSWDGSQFTEGLSGGNSKQQSVLTNVGEFGPNSGNSSDWHNANPGGGTQCINIIAAQDFVTLFSKGGFASQGCGFHIEIPQRLYPYEYDPNPICAMGIAYDMNMNDAVNGTTKFGYAHGFHMMTSDNKPNVHFLSIKHQSGDFYNTVASGNSLGGYSNGAYNGMFFNNFTNKFFFTDAIMGTVATAGQHYLARARLRRVRFIAPIIPTFHRVGDNFEWLHVRNGILWPWDNAVLPVSIFHQGY